MKRTTDNPPSRYPDRPIAEAPELWWVAKVKPRQEKALAADFIHHGIEYYLPMYTKTTRRRDNNKPRKSVLPLFPGYMAFNMDKPHNVFVSGRVVTIVNIKHQKRFVEELTQVYTALENGFQLAPFEGSFEIGDEVNVRYGPLRGLAGRVERTPDKNGRLILSVEGLGKALLTIDPAMVRPV